MKKIKTKSWLEIPLEENSFAPADSFLFGKNYFKNLALKSDFTDLIFFHLKGKMPTPSQKKWLNVLLNLGANPGIRDESARTAMNVAVGKGPVLNGLMAGLLARSGENRGALWVGKTMENISHALIAKGSLTAFSPFHGLGMHFGSADQRVEIPMAWLKSRKFYGKHSRFLEKCATPGDPVLLEGLIATGYLDLGFSPAQGSGLFLISCGPALFAYSLEQYDLYFKNYPNFFEPGSFIFDCRENPPRSIHDFADSEQNVGKPRKKVNAKPEAGNN